MEGQSLRDDEIRTELSEGSGWAVAEREVDDMDSTDTDTDESDMTDPDADDADPDADTTDPS